MTKFNEVKFEEGQGGQGGQQGGTTEEQKKRQQRRGNMNEGSESDQTY